MTFNKKNPTGVASRQLEATRIVAVCLLLAGLGAANTATACPTVPVNIFQYPDNTPLAGQGQTTDSTAWQIVGATPGTAFMVEHGKATIQSTGGQDYRISQGIGNSHPNLTTYFPSVEMLQRGPNDTPQVQGLEYYDAVSLTAAFGISEQTAGQRQFYAQIGTGSPVYSSSALADPNVYNYLMGKMEFNTDGNGLARLTVWNNASWSDVNGMTNFVVQTTGNLGTRTSLGTQQVLFSNNTDANSTHYKAWDDLFISTDPDVLALGRIQLTTDASHSQPGFETWNISKTPANSYSETRNWGSVGFLGRGTETVTVSANTPAENLTPLDAALTGGIGDGLRNSGVEAAGGVTLTFDNLLADSYTIKTFHYKPDAVGTVASQVEVWESNDGGALYDTGISFSPAATGDSATEVYTPVTSDGIHPVVLSFVPSSPGGVVPLNAFFIIPEPGTMMLLAAAGACLAGFAWRRRRVAA